MTSIEMSSWSILACSPAFVFMHHFLGRRWKHYGDSRSLPDFRCYAYVTTMFAYNGVGSAQAETGSVILGGEVRVVNLDQILFPYAAPAVLKDNFYIISRQQRISVVFNQRNAVNLNCQGTAIRHGMEGIEYDVVERLVDLLTVDINYLLRSAGNGSL